ARAPCKVTNHFQPTLPGDGSTNRDVYAHGVDGRTDGRTDGATLRWCCHDSYRGSRPARGGNTARSATHEKLAPNGNDNPFLLTKPRPPRLPSTESVKHEPQRACART
ncbi:unnamed protein product, partial [Scytosiphon promiscuus]